MLTNSQFSLIFKQLYLADEQKIKAINPDIIVPVVATEITSPILQDKAQSNTIKTSQLPITNSNNKSSTMVIQTKVIDKAINDVTNDTDFSIVLDKMQNCTLCELCDSRQNVVIERGNSLAKVMIVGDYPTQDDDSHGHPFSASNGELLDKMIQAMKLDVTQDVYITNLMKCKPKANLQPTHSQINLCKNYLFSQIKHVNPAIIIVLGRMAGQVLLNNTLSIKDMRNKVNYYNDIPVIVSYSVDTIKRASVDAKYFEYKKATWEDLQLAMQIIGKR